MSGPKACPRCTYPVLTAQREAKQRKRFVGYVLADSTAKELAHLLLLVMAHHADKDGECELANTNLARLCRCSEPSVRANLKKLLELGEIVQVSSGGGRGNIAVYSLRAITSRVYP